MIRSKQIEIMGDEELIGLVEAHRELYDKSNPMYRLHDQKRAIWERIAKKLQSKAELCIRRWTTLRERYGRESRRISASSGSGAMGEKSWPLMDSMAFLKEFIVPRPSRCSQNIVTPARSRSTSPLDPLILSPTVPSRWVSLPSPSPPLSTTCASPPSPSFTPPPFSTTCVSHPSPSPLKTTCVSHPSPSPLSTTCVSHPSPPPLSTTRVSHSSPPLLPSTRCGRKRKANEMEFDVDKSFCEAVDIFKRVCQAREAQVGNEAVHSFANMIASTVIAMTPAKQSRAMQRVTNIIMEMQREPDNDY